ncbi:MAG: hypothetical protein ABFR50_06830 [Candidatus Fermentibacteria bacterium]
MRRTLVFLVLMSLVSGIALASDSGAESTLLTFEAPSTDDTGDTFLTTIFASDNNFAGNSFDIMALTDLTIVGFDVNLATNLPNYTVDVWTREGTADGFETSAAGWTLLGSEVVVPNGVDVPTHVNVGGMGILAGDTLGVIITAQEAVSGTGGFSYTNGGPNYYGNGDMDIMTYRGLSDGFPPGNTFEYRAWNGTVHYNYGVALANETWGNIKAAF